MWLDILVPKTLDSAFKTLCPSLQGSLMETITVYLDLCCKLHKLRKKLIYSLK